MSYYLESDDKGIFSSCQSCRERFSRCQIHDIPDFYLLALACSFIRHAYLTKRRVAAKNERVGPDVRSVVSLPAHHRFVGGVGVAEFDRRRNLGHYINLVCGKARGSVGWRRGYKQTQCTAIAHLLGCWPLPLVTNGAMWFNLELNPEYGLNCLDHLIRYVRNREA